MSERSPERGANVEPARRPTTAAPADDASTPPDPPFERVAEASFALRALVGGDAPASSPARRPAPHWRALFAGSSPREILVRLSSGDPLQLRPRIARTLEARAFLVDSDVLHLRCVARIARCAQRYRGEPALEVWLDGRIDEALLELVADQGELEPDSPAASESAIAEFARRLELDPGRALAACAAFNQLPFDERSAFRALVLEGRSLDELAGAGRCGATELARAARRALEVVLTTILGKAGGR